MPEQDPQKPDPRPQWKRTLGDILMGGVDLVTGGLGLPVGPDSKTRQFGELLAAAFPVIGGAKALAGSAAKKGIRAFHGSHIQRGVEVVREAEAQLGDAWKRYESKLKAGQDVSQVEREIRGIETDISTLKKTTQMTGRDAYRDVAPRMADPVATERLKQAGIPGIKYLDGASRSAGQGSRNYVVFDDKLINIVKKYGVAGALLAGLINQAQAELANSKGFQ